MAKRVIVDEGVHMVERLGAGIGGGREPVFVVEPQPVTLPCLRTAQTRGVAAT